MNKTLTVKYLDELTYDVIGSAIEVHKTLGPGMLESLYHACMKVELKHRKINFLTEYKIPFKYRNEDLPIDFRCDLFIENCLVVELKAVAEMHPMFEAQLLTYMKLMNAPKGILINFYCSNIFGEGQKTFVNEFFRKLPAL